MTRSQKISSPSKADDEPPKAMDQPSDRAVDRIKRLPPICLSEAWNFLDRPDLDQCQQVCFHWAKKIELRTEMGMLRPRRQLDTFFMGVEFRLDPYPGNMGDLLQLLLADWEMSEWQRAHNEARAVRLIGQRIYPYANDEMMVRIGLLPCDETDGTQRGLYLARVSNLMDEVSARLFARLVSILRYSYFGLVSVVFPDAPAIDGRGPYLNHRIFALPSPPTTSREKPILVSASRFHYIHPGGDGADLGGVLATLRKLLRCRTIACCSTFNQFSAIAYRAGDFATHSARWTKDWTAAELLLMVMHFEDGLPDVSHAPPVVELMCPHYRTQGPPYPEDHFPLADADNTCMRADGSTEVTFTRHNFASRQTFRLVLCSTETGLRWAKLFFHEGINR